MTTVFNCWPTEWLRCAERAGLCEYHGHGQFNFIVPQETVDKIGRFAELLTLTHPLPPEPPQADEHSVPFD